VTRRVFQGPAGALLFASAHFCAGPEPRHGRGAVTHTFHQKIRPVLFAPARLGRRQARRAVKETVTANKMSSTATPYGETRVVVCARQARLRNCPSRPRPPNSSARRETLSSQGQPAFEPSLQAAFVVRRVWRHRLRLLAFSEIHPDIIKSGRRTGRPSSRADARGARDDDDATNSPAVAGAPWPQPSPRASQAQSQPENRPEAIRWPPKTTPGGLRRGLRPARTSGADEAFAG